MLFAVLIAVIGVILYCGYQNIAAATPEDVTFNPVTFQSGATVHVNADKSLTAIDGGTRLIANDLNGASGIRTKGTEQSPALNQYAGIAYGVDALVTSNTISNPKSLSEAKFRSNITYLRRVSQSYWLSNLYNRSSLQWASFATRNNSLERKPLIATGRDINDLYDYSYVAIGPYDWAEDVQVSNYTSPYGWSWAGNWWFTAGGYI